MNFSGLYEREDSSDAPFTRETLRLDVDGQYPQMAASGTGLAGLQVRAHWVAKPLAKVTTPLGDEWSGPILYKFGNTGLLPHDTVVMRREGTVLHASFRRTGFPDRNRDFEFQSTQFREVALEFDAEQGVDLVLDYQTHSHADRPSTLANETLSIDTAFERAGFRVIRTGNDSIVPTTGAGANERWSDNEMHDAMQVHFSRLAGLTPDQQNRARWALWTFFAGLHEEGVGLGGIMFDSIGTHRQGTALFLNSFISLAPVGETTPAAWRRRMAFWTTVHEMGHAFNLVHAWDKGATGGEFRLWVSALGGTASYDLLTFMNYPYLFETGLQSDANTVRFFKKFGFRFTDAELLFLRHAPERFVIMGGDHWGTNHAFEQARISPVPALKLEARVNRSAPDFEFMEPVVIELKLQNVSQQPVLIADEVLRASDLMTVQVQRRWGEPKAYHPYAHYCFQGNVRVLEPGQAVYESLFLSAGSEDWLIDTPGYYAVQICLHLPHEDLLCEPLELRVLPPKSWDEEYIAQDFFSEEVGRVLTFDGTRVLKKANETLREVTQRLPASQAAIHAQLALDLPRAVPFKMLKVSGDQDKGRYVIQEVEPATPALESLSKMLGEPQHADNAARSLGHIDYRYYSERVSRALVQQDQPDQAREVTACLHDTLRDRNAAPHVLAEIADSMKGLAALGKPPRRGPKK